MKIVHLIQYHLDGSRKKKGGKTPQLPDAGKPYVESVSYDKDAQKVRLRAQNARAGEVKTPLGDWQEFPVEVPTPTPLPDAGKPFVEGVTYDPDTKKVKVRAKVAQAGEVKNPLGEEQEFPIHVPTPPALPDAGKAYADKCEYDHATRTVTVHSRNPQAGEVKDSEGEIRKFPITLPGAGRLWVETKRQIYDGNNRRIVYSARARVDQAGMVDKIESGWTEVAVFYPPEDP